MTAKPPPTRDQNEASSAPLPPRLVHALCSRGRPCDPRPCSPLRRSPGSLRWPSFADWLSAFPCVRSGTAWHVVHPAVHQ